VSESHHFHVIVVIAVDHKKWEVPQENPSGGAAHARSGYDFADQRKFGYEFERCLDFIPEPLAKEG
jgi:hypothetical protein